MFWMKVFLFIYLTTLKLKLNSPFLPGAIYIYEKVKDLLCMLLLSFITLLLYVVMLWVLLQSTLESIRIK